MDVPEAHFHVTAGRLIRRAVRRELEKGAFALGLDYDIREDRGLLNSIYYVRASGARAADYLEAVTDWARRIDAEPSSSA